MSVHSITSNNTISNMATTQTKNSEDKNIQNQIALKEQTLSQLSSDSKMSKEEKEKKSQDIKNQIAELNRKLRLLEMKQKEETEKAEKEQQKKADTKETLKEERISDEKKDDAVAALEDEKTKHADMAIEDIQKMLNADYLLQRELALKSVTVQRENAINILETEIKQDSLRDADTTVQKETLTDMRKMENFWTENKIQPKEPLPSGMHADAQLSIE